jgi:hypothetical protein
MGYLAMGEIPDSWYEVLLLPLIFSVFGVVMWIGSRNAELKTGKPRPWKWAAAIPFLIALYTGWDPIARVRDFMYREAIEPLGKKMLMAHYAAFLVPVVALIALAVWHYMDVKRVASEY